MILMSAEHIIQVEQHALLVVPLTAVDQRDLVQSHNEDPSCGLFEVGKKHAGALLAGDAVHAGFAFDRAFQHTGLHIFGKAHQNLQLRNAFSIVDLIVNRNAHSGDGIRQAFIVGLIPFRRISERREHTVDKVTYPFAFELVVFIVVDDFSERSAHGLQTVYRAFLNRKLLPWCGSVLHRVRKIFLHVERRIEIIDRFNTGIRFVQFSCHRLLPYSLPTNAAATRMIGLPEAFNESRTQSAYVSSIRLTFRDSSCVLLP